jgi:hypothetical protein
MDLEVLGDTIDVKTKDRTVYPLGCYDCSVPLYNHEHQRPERFVFVSLFREKGNNGERIERFIKAYIVGWCTLEQVDRGEVWAQGDVDTNGIEFWTACKNVHIKDLRRMTEMLAEYQARRARDSSAM